MFCIKLSLNSKIRGIFEFSSQRERDLWLLKAGFVDRYSHWRHPFSKEIAGLFTSSPTVEVEKNPFFKTCDKVITLGKSWSITNDPR